MDQDSMTEEEFGLWQKGLNDYLDVIFYLKGQISRVIDTERILDMVSDAEENAAKKVKIADSQ